MAALAEAPGEGEGPWSAIVFPPSGRSQPWGRFRTLGFPDGRTPGGPRTALHVVTALSHITAMLQQQSVLLMRPVLEAIF